MSAPNHSRTLNSAAEPSAAVIVSPAFLPIACARLHAGLAGSPPQPTSAFYQFRIGAEMELKVQSPWRQLPLAPQVPKHPRLGGSDHLNGFGQPVIGSDRPF